MSIYNRAMIHAPRLHLPGNRKIKRVRLANSQRDILVRLGSSDWYAMEEVFIHGEYQRLTSQLRSVNTIVDLGVNVGMSLRLWQTVYPDARVLGVEPDPGNVEMARLNIGDAPNVRLVQACVASRPRKVRLDRSISEYAFRMVERGNGSGNTEAIDALTLPQLLDDAQFDGEIDLLKCDIEGAEAEVFGDCAEWIGRVRNMVVEVHTPYTAERLLEDVSRAGSSLRAYHVESKGSFGIVFLSSSESGPS